MSRGKIDREKLAVVHTILGMSTGELARKKSEWLLFAADGQLKDRSDRDVRCVRSKA